MLMMNFIAAILPYGNRELTIACRYEYQLRVQSGLQACTCVLGSGAARLGAFATGMGTGTSRS
eukprot:scaffold453534_cov17-Prasinocladus_malaysianus.AAC.1